MNEAVLEINVTEFKAKCLTLFKALEARRYDKVVVTRRGKAIAELTPAQTEVPISTVLAQGACHHPAGGRSDRPRPGGHSRSRIGRGGPLVVIVLLDTCAAVWVEQRRGHRRGAVRDSHRRRDCGDFVSPVTAWEIGLATTRRAILSCFDHGAKLARRSPGPTGCGGSAEPRGALTRVHPAGQFPPRPGGSPPDRDGARAQGPAGHPRSPNSGLRRAGARGRHRLLSAVGQSGLTRRGASSALRAR